MSIDLTTNEPDWTSLQGETLEGGYELTEILRVDDSGATFKVRVLGDHLRRACVNVYPVPPGNADEQLAVWEGVRELRHSNLRLPLAIGRLERGGTELVYLVLDREDEKLSGPLRDRALNKEEAGEVLQSLAGALEYLHSVGFVHGCVAPEQVLAIGDSILLSTDCVRRINTAPIVEIAKPKYQAPESAEGNVTPAADVWCLGATLFEALTQKDYDDALREEAGQLAAPFGLILERCLDFDSKMRMRPAEVIQVLRQRPVPTPRAEPIPISKAAAGPISVASPSKPPLAAPAFPVQQAPLFETGRVPERRSIPQPRSVPEPRHPRAIPLLPARVWMYAAAGLVVVLGLLFLSRSKPVSKPARTVAKSVQPSQNPPRSSGASNGAWETRTLTPDASSARNEPPGGVHRAPSGPPNAAASADAARRTPRAPSLSKTATTKSEASPSKGSIWRVVVYAYAHADDAAKRAHSINEKHPDLKAESFSPNGQTGPYVVVVGGPMNRDDAVHFRQKALRAGMPRDSYLQNYKQ